MKLIYYTIIMLLINTSIAYGQTNTISTVNDRKYIFAESSSENSYTSSFIFSKNEKEKIADLLNLYFEDPVYSNNKSVWKKLKGTFSEEDIFYVELKNKKLKIEWKNKQQNIHKETIRKMKKISQDIRESLK